MSERDEFEAWADHRGHSLLKDEEGAYKSLGTYALWQAWQAALNTQAVPALRPDVIADLIWRHTGLSEEQFPDAYGDSVSLVKAVLAEVAAPQPSQEPEKAVGAETRLIGTHPAGEQFDPTKITPARQKYQG